MKTIDQQIKDYKPNRAGAELLGTTEVLLLVGITGAGKDTVLHEMLKSGTFHNLITTVTRPPRYNNGILEQDGMDYHFISDDDAHKLLEAGEYVEASLVHGRVYGVTADEIRRAHDDGKTAIADVDVQGAAKYKKVSDNVTVIFLVPPNYVEWRRRVRHRYASEAEFLEDWPNRRQSAVVELERALLTPYYHFVINDDLAETVRACMQIAQRHNEFVRKDEEVRLRTRDLLEALLAEIQREEK